MTVESERADLEHTCYFGNGCAACFVGRPAENDAPAPSRTIRVTVEVDTDELREWAGRHADAGRHGVAHALYDAATRYEAMAVASVIPPALTAEREAGK